MASIVASKQGFVVKERACRDDLVLRKSLMPSFHLLNCLPSGKTLLKRITEDL